jgi:hypothetical protein
MLTNGRQPRPRKTKVARMRTDSVIKMLFIILKSNPMLLIEIPLQSFGFHAAQRFIKVVTKPLRPPHYRFDKTG